MNRIIITFLFDRIKITASINSYYTLFIVVCLLWNIFIISLLLLLLYALYLLQLLLLLLLFLSQSSQMGDCGKVTRFNDVLSTISFLFRLH